MCGAYEMMDFLWKPFRFCWGYVARYPWYSSVIAGILTAIAALLHYHWWTLVLGSLCGTIIMVEAEKTAPPAP
jgi:hypothetical protein